MAVFSALVVVAFVMAFLASSTFGTLLNLTTLYPAFVSKPSLAASTLLRPLWLESSSSITAVTSKPFPQTTKSAVFLSKVLRAPMLLASSKAENATCGITTWSGMACTKRKYMACSRSVKGRLARGVSPVRTLPLMTPTPTPITTISSNSGHSFSAVSMSLIGAIPSSQFFPALVSR